MPANASGRTTHATEPCITADGVPAAGGAVSIYLKLVGQLLGLATPVAMLLVIDKVVHAGAAASLGVLVTGVGLLTCFQGLFLYVAARTGSADVERRALGRRREVLAALLGSRAAPHLASAGWDAADQAVEACRFETETRSQAAADVCFVAMLTLLMLAFSPRLTAVALGFVPAYLAAALYGARYAARHASAAASGRGALATRLLEAAGAVDTVQTLNLAGRLGADWSEHDAALAAVRHRLVFGQRLTALTVESLQRLSLLAVMLFGVSAVMGGSLSLGQYVAFNLLAMQLGAPLLRLTALQRARTDHELGEAGRRRLLAGCAQAQYPMAASPLSLSAGDGPVQLEAAALVPHLPGRNGALNFAARGGQWLAVSGRSGCGKSTLLRVLAGLQAPAAGAVLWDGVSVARLSTPQRSRLVRLVPQDPVVFSGTLAENVHLGDPEASPLQVAAAADACGLLALASRLPDHLNTVVGAGGWTLSGGERARLCIARAIVSRPRALLLDEATAALDAAAEAALFARLRLLLPDTLVVVVSHRQASLARCERWLRLDPPVPVERAHG